MFDEQKQHLAEQLEVALFSLGIDDEPSIEWRNIPFSGKWGIGTAISFQLAGREIKTGAYQGPVKERAQEIASELAEMLGDLDFAGHVEANNGYINFYFQTSSLAAKLMGDITTQAGKYGQGEKQPGRVMIEYSQPNTHKAFHIGHFRNVALGHSMALILRHAGYETITANYLGDIGMHVIKCLWSYLKYHKDEEPTTGKGRWLGNVYAEADRRIELRDHMVSLIKDTVSLAPSFFVRQLDAFTNEIFSDATQNLVFNKLRLHYALDSGWQAALDTFGMGLTAEDASVESILDNLGTSAVVLDGGPDNLYHHWLRELLTNQNVKGAQRYLGQISSAPFVETIIRNYGPLIWQKTKDWLDVARGQEELDQVALSRLIEDYDDLAKQADWWSDVDIWNLELRDLFQRWEAKDPQLMTQWEKTRQWSLDEFNKIYDSIGAEFQVDFFESQVEEEGKEIVDELIQMGIAEDLRPEGPVLVHIDRYIEAHNLSKRKDEPHEFRTCLILRSDGTSLYSTKDLSLAKRKFEDFNVTFSIYVVDTRQQFYFQQIFKILELMGFEQARNCYHLAYEMVNLPSGTMSSRLGNVVLFEDLLDEALERAYTLVCEKNPDLSEKEKRDIARKVALGSLKYAMLSVDNNNVITFDWDAALSFEGRSAPYIQYAYARACRILEKAESASNAVPDFSYLDISVDSVDQKVKGQLLTEINLVEKLSEFPEIVKQSSVEYKPHLIATYVYELANLFNMFYHKADVIRGDVPDEVRAARLALVKATSQTLTNGLTLLGIEAPNKM